METWKLWVALFRQHHHILPPWLLKHSWERKDEYHFICQQFSQIYFNHFLRANYIPSETNLSHAKEMLTSDEEHRFWTGVVGFKSYLYHLLAMWLWLKALVSFSASIQRDGIITYLIITIMRQWDNFNAFRIVPGTVDAQELLAAILLTTNSPLGLKTGQNGWQLKWFRISSYKKPNLKISHLTSLFP